MNVWDEAERIVHENMTFKTPEKNYDRQFLAGNRNWCVIHAAQLNRLEAIERAAREVCDLTLQGNSRTEVLYVPLERINALIDALQPLRAGERSKPAKSACECCNGTGIGPVNSNFTGRPCMVCGGRG